MEVKSFILIFGYILNIQTVLGIWSCSQDSDCSIQVGSVCMEGSCGCLTGQQSVLGGTLCADAAPYYSSSCYEDHQCSRIFGPIECRDANNTDAGSCYCQPDHHYFLGRCWPSREYGQTCTRDEECMGVLRDPYNMKCDGTCVCADGFYSRQRGECRKIASAVGDGCVLDEDCQFEGGACAHIDFRCYNVNEPAPAADRNVEEQADLPEVQRVLTSRQSGQMCSANSPCPQPFICSSFGVCICPLGYYSSDDGSTCSAELGSPSTLEQCTGLFAELRNGVCTCQVNFYFEENMRDCVKATTRITDSCVSDSNCHTFGSAARCGPPQDPWGLRSCECIPEMAVWDSARNMCRLFAGIGEACEVDSDCLAGDLEIQCMADDSGQGYCTCPEGLLAVDGLCLTTGLELGDACQATQECTETANTVCAAGRCSCDNGYQEVDDFCAPIIGGICEVDNDCVIENTVCQTAGAVSTCQCDSQFVEYDEECWPVVGGHGSACNVSLQCEEALGAAGSCLNGTCACADGYHYRDGGCWPITGLFESCNRNSQCFLGDLTYRVTCRNSLCQCQFDYPYSEELHTCTGGSSGLVFSSALVIAAFSMLMTILS